MRWTAKASAFSAALVSVILVAGLAAAFGGAILGGNIVGRTTTSTQTTTSILTTTSTLTSTSVQTQTETLPRLTTTATTTLPVTTTVKETSTSTTTAISTSFSTISTTSTRTVTNTSTVTITASTTSTVDFSTTLPTQIVESCSGSGSHQRSARCTLQDSQYGTLGSMLIVEVSDVGPVVLSDSNGNSFTQLCDVSLPDSTYGLLLYSSIGNFTNPDTISLTGGGNYPNLVVHEISGMSKAAGVSVGSGVSNSPSVSVYSPAPNSFVIGALLTIYPAGQPLVSVSAGQGYTLIGQYGGAADEYQWPANANTSSTFSMNYVDSWAEASISLSR